MQYTCIQYISRRLCANHVKGLRELVTSMNRARQNTMPKRLEPFRLQKHLSAYIAGIQAELVEVEPSIATIPC